MFECAEDFERCSLLLDRPFVLVQVIKDTADLGQNSAFYARIRYSFAEGHRTSEICERALRLSFRLIDHADVQKREDSSSIVLRDAKEVKGLLGMFERCLPVAAVAVVHGDAVMG